MGWDRFFSYIKHRVIRIGDSPRNIALGLAIGLAVSFNPFFGTHIAQALVLCFLFRANYLAAAIGTLAGNPVTFPVFWAMSAPVGHIWVADPFWAWVIGGYIVGAFSLLTYWAFLPLISAAKMARLAMIAHKQSKKGH
jgi:uncharacterized protein (DUF2062 family)